MTKVRTLNFQFNRAKLSNLQSSFNCINSKNDYSDSGQCSRSQGDDWLMIDKKYSNFYQ